MKKLLVLLLLTTSLFAKNLYVNSSIGNDATTYTNNSAGTPWATVGRAVWGQSTRPAGLNTDPVANDTEAAQAGDTVFVIAGTYDWSGTQYSNRGTPIYKTVNEGSAGNYIVIKAVGTVYLTDSSTPNSSVDGQPIIGSQDRDYIIWDGFYIDEASCNTHQDVGPVAVFGSNYVTIQNCTIIGVLYAWNDNHVGIRIENCSNITAFNNTISNFRYYATTNDSQNCTGIETYNTDNVTIYNNTITNCGSGMYIKQGNGGTYNIYKNKIDACGTHGILLQQTVLANVYQNLIIDTPSGFKIQSYASGYGPNGYIVNNTVYNSTTNQGGFYISSIQYTTSLVVQNNIFSNNSPYGIAASGVAVANFDARMTFEHNHYYSNATHANVDGTTYTLSTFKSTRGQETATGNGRAGEESDPQFVNASADSFQLQSGANPEDGGVDILNLAGGGTSAAIHRGAYITGNETIGSGAVAEEEEPPVGPGSVTIKITYIED